MIKPNTVLIPINEIRIVNPRSRNQITFNTIKASIASVGLKKPITVRERALEDDGTRYDLVCGQGRLESVRDLGEAMIDAIVNDAPRDECYIMSLVENLARRSPCATDLLREVKRLNGQHYRPKTIAEKLGLDKSYIYGIINLLRHGEDDLIKRVEAGSLPIEIAIKIATGGDVDIQHALCEAYDNGTLRGAKLLAVQQLVIRRKGSKSSPATKRSLTSADLLRAYEHHTQQQRALVRRSTLITERLAILTSSVRRLLADDHLVTLLRAEGLRSMPDFLAVRVAAPNEERRCP